MDVILSDRCRRWICQAAFLLLCIVPTVAVMRWVLFPVTAADWSKYIESETGLVATVESVESTSPQKSVLNNVRLGQAEHDSQVLLDRVVLENSADARRVVIGHLVGSPQAIWHCLNRISDQANWGSASRRPIVVQADNLTIQRYEADPSRSMSFRDVKLTINSDRSRLDAQFHVIAQSSEENEPQPIQISLQQRPSGEIAWRVDTHQHALPIWLVRRALPRLSFLNDDCQASGSVVWTDNGQRCHGEFSARLTGVDLTRSLSDHVGYVWSGQAEIEISRGVVDNGQFRRLEGQLIAEGGEMGVDLRQALNRNFGMQWVDERDGTRYHRLHCQFQLRDFRFQISSVSNDGTIARNQRGRPLLICPEGRWHQVNDLLAFLWHPTQSINQEMISLMQYLPLPHSQTQLRIPEMRRADERQLGDSYLR